MITVEDIVKIEIRWWQNTDVHDDNVDVQVVLSDDRIYFAQIFTVFNIIKLMDKFRTTGECNFGSYFWACDMIIVQSLTTEIIENAIRDLAKSGRFEEALCQIFPSQETSVP